ncbi:MAG: DUF2723 domain-containing protein [Gemmatimonadota bacterium]
MASALVSTNGELDYRPSYMAATIAALAVLGLYLLTLAPTTAMWDTSEYIAAAYTLGLPHPPGNPLFVLVGRVFAVLPIAPTVAMRINVLAAICSAASAAMWFLVTERVLVGWLPKRWHRILGAGVATLIGATAFTVWNQSVVNEKVYTVSLAGIAVISWLMIRWSDEPEGRTADRILVLVAYLLGLGYANHMAGMLPSLAVGAAIMARKPATILRWRLLLAAAAALVFGLTPFATQPIRAAYMPAMNEGEPTACQDGLKFSCTFSQGTYDRFMYNFNRGQYGKPKLTERQAPITGQIGMWWYYFKWQWLRDAHNEQQAAQALLAAVFLVLGLFGGWVHFKRDRRSFWYFGTLMMSMTVLLIVYLNFKYGATQAPELRDVDREVRDRDYFYLWSFSAWGVWAGLGLLFVWETVASMFGVEDVQVAGETVSEPRPRSWLYGSPVLALALVPLFTNWSTASRRGHTDTADFAHDLLNSVEPYGILVVVGDNDTFPLWFAQQVEGVRKDIVIANTSLLNTDWYTRQLIRRPVYDYDEAKGPAIYRGKNWPKPVGSPLKMTTNEADSVPGYMIVDKPVGLGAGELRWVLDPKRMSPDGNGNGLLQRADIFVLRMLSDSWPGRPFYFSRTSGPYARELGLGDNVLTQGLAAKVFLQPKAATPDTAFVQGDGWIDIKRTRQLWSEVFKAPKSLVRRGDWIDQPSIGIPYLYFATGVQIAEVLREKDPLASRVMVNESKALAKAMRLDAAALSLDQFFPESAMPVTAGDTLAAKSLMLPPKAPANAPPTKPTKKP